MKNKLIDSILIDDLESAKSILAENPNGLDLLSDLLLKLKNKKSPLKELKRKGPKIISISTSFTCKLRCKMCSTGFTNRTNLFNNYNFFSPRQFKKISPWIDLSSYISLNGMGETLDSPYISRFLKQTNNKGSSVTTSGVPLNKKKIRTLIESGLNIIGLSFDGNSSLGHGGGKVAYVKKFWKRVETIQNIKKELKSKLPNIVLYVTVNRENLDNLEEIFKTALNYKIENVFLMPMTVGKKSLFHKSIFLDFDESKKRINSAILRWSKKGLNIRITEQKKLKDSLKTCPFVDNCLFFSYREESPALCCGPISLPLEISGLTTNQFWNSFPLRYFRFLHFCSKPDALPVLCQQCWYMNPKKYAETCSPENDNSSISKAMALYRKASELKLKKRIEEARKRFLEVLTLDCDNSLKGKTYFHLGEIYLNKKNHTKALSFMKLSVQHCFDHRMAFAYLYLLLALVERPKPLKPRKKFSLRSYKELFQCKRKTGKVSQV